MPDFRYRNCRKCGRHSTEVGPLSWTRLCIDCSKQIFDENLTQLRDHSGPHFDYHRRRCLAAFGGVPAEDVLRVGLDDLAPTP